MNWIKDRSKPRTTTILNDCQIHLSLVRNRTLPSLCTTKGDNIEIIHFFDCEFLAVNTTRSGKTGFTALNTYVLKNAEKKN